MSIFFIESLSLYSIVKINYDRRSLDFTNELNELIENDIKDNLKCFILGICGRKILSRIVEIGKARDQIPNPDLGAIGFTS